LPDSRAVLHVVLQENIELHDTGRGLFDAGPWEGLGDPEPHPEGPRRLRNAEHALRTAPYAERLSFRPAPPATRKELLRFHTEAHLERVRSFAALEGPTRIAGHTFASAGTPDAAAQAAGGAVLAADLVAEGSAPMAYALGRPPGHHAGPEQIDGYCFFNGTTLAAQRLLDRGAARVAVVDLDVHHGNGTQSGFYERDDVLTISVHMDHRSWGPTHPEDGLPEEAGAGPGEGANVNVALPYGVGDRGYLAVMDEVVAPALRAYAPEGLVLALGVDASQNDPNGRQCVSAPGFHALGGRLRDLAGELTGGRLVAVQEGGYGPSYSAFCLQAAIAGLLGEPVPAEDPVAYLPDEETGHREAIARTRAVPALAELFR
jgi:acetoin utilization deacetylase AcuC-like enzyme